MQDMAKRGFGGFFIHARSGMTTEYMSEEWFDLVGFCIDKSEELGLEAWIYDENGWPSGFCGGELLKEEFYISYLRFESNVPFDERALGNYIFENGKYIRVQTPREGIAEYFVVRKIVNDTYVDLMNPNLARAFVESTHEKYKARFGNRFKGFFTDEPQYSREGIPWSKYLKAEYESRGLGAVEDALIYLFVECGDISKAVRYDYYTIASELFVGFQKYVFEWCDKNGYLTTGHTIDENCLYGQIACCGNAMTFYEYEHIPGIDWLTRHVGRNFPVKQAVSVAEQLGRKQILSETFAAAGWNCTPPTLKRIADFQIANGVNLFCFHMYPYSIRGERKRDYPPFFSEHNSWMRESGVFNGYLERVGELLGEGERRPRILLIHPLTGAYMDFDRYDAEKLGYLEEIFEEANGFLTDNQLPYHFGDEALMKKYATVSDGKLQIGECTYDFVLLPDTTNLTDNTYRLLKEYISQGGKFFRFGEKLGYKDGRPFRFEGLSSTTTKEEILATAEFRVQEGKGFFAQTSAYGNKKAVFLLNYTDSERKVEITATANGVKEYDLFTGKTYRIEREKGVFTTAFAPFESKAYILDDGEGELPAFALVPEKEIEDGYELVEAENYFALDKAEFSTDGVNYSAVSDVLAIRKKLLDMQYSGKVYLRYRFENKSAYGKMYFATEKAKDIRVSLNGKPCRLTEEKRLDEAYLLYDIGDCVLKGENEIVQEMDYYQREEVYYVLYGEGVSETMLNKLVYDTELEPSYLIGEFEVSVETNYPAPQNDKPLEHPTRYLSGFALTEQKKKVYIKDLLTGGYPFMTGRMKVKKKTGALQGYLKAKFSTQDICVNVNGKPVGCLYGFNSLKIDAPALENELELDIAFNPRNLFGPFHAEEAESYCITALSFYETANSDKYSLVEQGVEELWICKNEGEET